MERKKELRAHLHGSQVINIQLYIDYHVVQTRCLYFTVPLRDLLEAKSALTGKGLSNRKQRVSDLI